MNAMISELRRPYSGVYTIHDAALYLRATTPPREVNLHEWSARRDHFIEPSAHQIAAWIRHGLKWEEPMHLSGAARAISFEDLIRLRFIAILRSRGFRYPEIRRAEELARDITGMPQPFVTEPLWTQSSLLFVQFSEVLISLLGPRKMLPAQIALDWREYMAPVFHGLHFDASGIASRWSPFPGVTIDPAVQFGAPCVSGTRVDTEALWSFNQAGDSVQSIAKMYGLLAEQVKAAIDWERTVDMAA